MDLLLWHRFFLLFNKYCSKSRFGGAFVMNLIPKEWSNPNHSRHLLKKFNSSKSQLPMLYNSERTKHHQSGISWSLWPDQNLSRIHLSFCCCCPCALVSQSDEFVSDLFWLMTWVSCNSPSTQQISVVNGKVIRLRTDNDHAEWRNARTHVISREWRRKSRF